MDQVISRAEAREQGRKRFYTGEPCPLGHIAERQVSNGTCIVCRNHRAAVWQKANREARRVIEKRTRKKNPAFAAKCNERTKAWQAANQERHRAVKRAWKDNNPERNRYYVSQRRARILKSTLPGYDEWIKRIYFECPAGYHVDHIIPLQHPLLCGLHVPWNLQYLPATENMRKGNRVPGLD